MPPIAYSLYLSHKIERLSSLGGGARPFEIPPEAIYIYNYMRLVFFFFFPKDIVSQIHKNVKLKSGKKETKTPKM